MFKGFLQKCSLTSDVRKLTYITIPIPSLFRFSNSYSHYTFLNTIYFLLYTMWIVFNYSILTKVKHTKTGPQPHPQHTVSEAGLCPSSTWPVQGNMVGGGGLQPPRNSPSAVPSTDHALSGCLPELRRPNDCDRAHQELYHLPVYLFV